VFKSQNKLLPASSTPRISFAFVDDRNIALDGACSLRFAEDCVATIMFEIVDQKAEFLQLLQQESL